MSEEKTPLEIWKEYSSEYSRFYVPDIVIPTSKYVIIAESPHTEEVKKGYPLAGKSGEVVLSALLKTDTYKNNVEAIITDFSIINVCNVPLQNLIKTISIGKLLHKKGVVCQPNFINEIDEKIRKSPNSDSATKEFQTIAGTQGIDYILSKDNLTKIRNDIRCRFCEKMKNYAGNSKFDKDVVFIVCGNFAHSYIDYLTGKGWTNISTDRLKKCKHPSPLAEANPQSEFPSFEKLVGELFRTP